MKISKYVEMRNSLYSPNFGKCSRCGGSWGWKNQANHPVSKSSSIFLFCVECDKKVTVEERWKALDEWKLQCVKQAGSLESVREILATEFSEWPRGELK